MKISGRIDYYNQKRGFGFVIDAEEPFTKRFFHATNVVSGNPQAGRGCVYEAGQTSRGLVALDVEVLGGSR